MNPTNNLLLPKTSLQYLALLTCFKKNKTKTHTPDFIKKGREPRILPITRPSAYQREEAVLGASRPTGLPSGRMRGHDDGESRGGGQTVRV